MSFFSKLFGGRSLRLPSLTHPIFGRMDATLETEPDLYFWETPGGVETEFGEISIFCDAPTSGPTDAQVKQFQHVCTAFSKLEAMARPLLLERLRDFQSEDQIDAIKWVSILLATDGEMSSNWELTFEDPKSLMLLNVNFKDGRPAFVTVDT